MKQKMDPSEHLTKRTNMVLINLVYEYKKEHLYR